MNDVTKPHDRFIRELLSDQKTVREFLENYLPEELLKEFDLNHISAIQDTFVDQTLHEYFTDMLYTVPCAEGKGYVYILFEHKSYDEPMAILQCLGYQVKIWQLFRKQNKRKPLPVIVPILVYHGLRAWKHGSRLSALVRASSPALSAFVPDFSFILCDLTGMKDSQIKGSLLLRLSFLLMKYIQKPDVIHNLKRIFASFKDQGDYYPG